jgi:hypothetical protein
MKCIHYYSELQVKNVTQFVSIQIGVASIGTLMSLILLIKAVRLKKNNAFFILIFTLIFVGFAFIILFMWIVEDGTKMVASQ